MIIHIGFPKCGSTTLQKLFPCTDARFLGCDPKRDAGDFYEPELGFFFEGVFRFGTDRQFEAEADNIRDFLSAQDKEHNGRVVLSNENLCHRLTPWDLPTDIKMKRLGYLAPAGSKIVVVHRPVLGFVTSLYKNHLMFGYTGSFDEFLEELIVMKDYGILADLKLEHLCDNVLRSFNDPQIMLLDLTKPDNFQHLFKALGLCLDKVAVSTNDVENKGPDAKATALWREYNLIQPNRKRFFDWLETHRLLPRTAMKEGDLFWVSRNRIGVNQYAADNQNSDVTLFDEDSIDWPDDVLKIDRDNEAFLGRLAGHQSIQVV